ncbi:MAG: DNA polymerase III subunit beta [Candidatus Krumholzibacteriota bacterium]|nr:DNA polymerase III subunit beta [Candidatus Krumholzibacteriota bacterium]
MKVVIPLEELSKKMNAISSVVPGKTTMPILSMVLLKAESSGITFSATDLDISVTSTVNGKVVKGGGISAPAKKIAEIVKSLSQGDVTLSSDDGEKLTIECAKSKFSVNGRSADDFPKLPKQDSKTEFSIETSLLSRLIQKTIYAVSTDLTRPALCGVKWEVDKTGVLMVSTDGHRLAKAETKLSLGDIKKSEVIVPPKALATFKSYAEKNEMIKVSIGDNSISFEMKEVSIYSRLLEGPFPNYQKVIPSNNTKELLISKEALNLATKRVAILSDALTHQVIFSLGKNSLRLHVATQDLGEATEDIDATYSDEKMEIGYNAAYVQDILRTFDTDEIAFKLDRPDNAGIITPVEQDGEIKQLCIVMPLRILG